MGSVVAYLAIGAVVAVYERRWVKGVIDEELFRKGPRAEEVFFAILWFMIVQFFWPFFVVLFVVTFILKVRAERH